MFELTEECSHDVHLYNNRQSPRSSLTFGLVTMVTRYRRSVVAPQHLASAPPHHNCGGGATLQRGGCGLEPAAAEFPDIGGGKGSLLSGLVWAWADAGGLGRTHGASHGNYGCRYPLSSLFANFYENANVYGSLNYPSHVHVNIVNHAIPTQIN